MLSGTHYCLAASKAILDVGIVGFLYTFSAIILTHGRTLAAIPKSTIQMSTGFAAGLSSLLLVHLLEH
jgi:hypothetical protein